MSLGFVKNMDEKQIKQLISDHLDNYATDNQYGVSKVPYHAHTGVDSAQVTDTNLIFTRTARNITQSATPVINTDITSVAHITGLAQAITSMTTNLTGNPQGEDLLRIDITDDGTARAITWGSKFESSGTITLPTTTVVNVRLDVGFVYNPVTSKWRCIATA